MFRVSACSALLAVVVLALAAQAQNTPRTERLCVLAGMGDARAEGQEALRLYGTDMGMTYRRGRAIEILFGDTWPAPFDPATALERDDAFGSIDLAAFPDGDAVEAHCRTARRAPPIALAAASSTEFAPLNPGIAMDGLKTPILAFAAGTAPHSREYAMFVTAKPVPCASDAQCGAYKCDVGLGYWGAPPQDMGPGLTFACVDGRANCTAQTLPGDAPSGVCVDPGNSLAAPGDDNSRADSAVWRHLVGLRSPSGLRDRYTVQEWPTARFRNAIAASVENYDPGRRNGDYRPASGTSPRGDGVFIWGRPGWIGIQSEERNLHLYLAWLPMPEIGADDSFAWRPFYFAGLGAEGRPLFVPDPLRAAPLDLSGGAGEVPEIYDPVGQMSVRWIAPLRKWVMFYGGGFMAVPELCQALFINCGAVQRARAAIRMRTADHPWGPWSPPQDVLVGGEPADGPIVASQYAPGGVLHHPRCQGESCAPSTPPLGDQAGWLYAPNIIEEWTEVRSAGAVDLYWNVSSWNPYRVTLMKTRISPAR